MSVLAYPKVLAGDASAEGSGATSRATEAPTLEALYAAHAAYVAQVVFRILGDDAEVDDVVQETFVDAMKGDLTRVESIRAWLVTVAVRRTRRALGRRRRRWLLDFLSIDLAPRASDPSLRGAVDELYDVLGRLPEELRIPWILHRVEALSLPETAAACEVSLATVKRRIAEAEQFVARRLA